MQKVYNCMRHSFPFEEGTFVIPFKKEVKELKAN